MVKYESDKLKEKLIKLRNDTYNLKGSYEDSYIFFMNKLDKIIESLK